MLKVALSIGFVMLLFCSYFAQSHFAQFRAVGLSTESDCRNLEDLLRDHSGLEGIRAEAKSGNVLLMSSGPISFDLPELLEWLAGSGYSVRCFRSGVVGVDPILRLLNDCDAPPGQPQRE